MSNLQKMRTKTYEELMYIVKDAEEAAEAMRGVSYEAECKYLDQVNDACTELHRRRQQLILRGRK
jgi:hypothetical protein